eukprot:13546562-Ditylum_brightwellii.AAC.1
MKKGSRGLQHPFLCFFGDLIKMGELDASPFLNFLGYIHTLGAWTTCIDGKGESWRLCHSLLSIINLFPSMPFMKKEMEKISAR